MGTDISGLQEEIDPVIDALSMLLKMMNVSHVVGGAAMSVLLSRLERKHKMHFHVIEEPQAGTDKPKLTLVKSDA